MRGEQREGSARKGAEGSNGRERCSPLTGDIAEDRMHSGNQIG